MVWVDRILDVTGDRGTTEVTLTHPLMLDRGRAHVGALVEFLAQSYGFIRAVDATRRLRRLTTAQLVAIDRFELLSETLPLEGETLTAELKTVRDLDPLYLAKGRILTPQRRIVCTIEFKGYAVFTVDRSS